MNKIIEEIFSYIEKDKLIQIQEAQDIKQGSQENKLPMPYSSKTTEYPEQLNIVKPAKEKARP